ncbi:hypothetical protein AB0C33_45205 [Nonomuraea sp. NPDC048881]|uniref:hypothetical protein n=1 Tax=Nonomuraea sp. NPDC048881 TaxID=3155030 RepID=UPI003400953E
MKRRILIPISVLVVGACAAWLGWRSLAPRQEWDSGIGNERIRYVLLNAFGVANSDIRVEFDQLAKDGHTISEGVGEDGDIEVVLDSRRLRRGESHPQHDAIRLRQGGLFGIPSIAGIRLSGALQRFADDRDETLLSRADLKRTLSRLSRTGVLLQAVVKLKQPLLEKSLPTTPPIPQPLDIEAVLLSPGASGQKPISWDVNNCEYRLPSGPCTQGLAAQFQAWVQSLRPEDAQPLELIGLRYEELQLRAREPKAYGFITESTPEVLAWLMQQPEVARIELTDIGFLRSS